MGRSASLRAILHEDRNRRFGLVLQADMAVELIRRKREILAASVALLYSRLLQTPTSQSHLRGAIASTRQMRAERSRSRTGIVSPQLPL